MIGSWKEFCNIKAKGVYHTLLTYAYAYAYQNEKCYTQTNFYLILALDTMTRVSCIFINVDLTSFASSNKKIW